MREFNETRKQDHESTVLISAEVIEKAKRLSKDKRTLQIAYSDSIGVESKQEFLDFVRSVSEDNVMQILRDVAQNTALTEDEVLKSLRERFKGFLKSSKDQLATEFHSKDEPLATGIKGYLPMHSRAQPKKTANRIMVYCKPYDNDVVISFVKLHQYFQENQPGIEILVDDWMIPEIERELRRQGKPILKKQPTIFINDGEAARRSVDFIITLGGDGTILWASKQFRRDYFPPLVAFSHGSLGYMCNFEFDEHIEVLDKLLATD